MQVSINLNDFMMKMVKLKARSNEAKRFSLYDIGNEIMRLSQMEVPHDKGTLQNSGNVELIGEDIVVGYHTPYAHRLHEHPEYHFQRGRKGKFLTDPISRNQRALGLKFNERFKEKIG